MKSGKCQMILIALGSNLPHPQHGAPEAVLKAAIALLEAEGVRVVARSAFYRTAPVPASDQPDFVNAVVAVESPMEPAALLALLHRIEESFGRRRAVRNEARVLDLDLLAWKDRVSATEPLLPHPRLHERAFVLLPLHDVAPGWRHPVRGKGVDEMIADLPPAALAGVRRSDVS
jgi:2-amino-4-hydroxy-6-hydroxymethyldihydropteridine diphosphokinase